MNWSRRFTCAALLIAALYSVSQPSANASLFAARSNVQSITNDISESRADAPRYTFFTSHYKLVRFPSEFCGGEDYQHCDYSQYVESLLLPSSGVTIFLAVVSLLFGVVFWMLRSCLCGGCSASEGTCVPGEHFASTEGGGYGRKHVLCIKIGVVACLLCMVPFLVVGSLANENAHTTVTNFGDTVINTVAEAVETIEYINSTLGSLEYDDMPFNRTYVMEELNAALEEGRSIQSRGVTLRADAERVNQYHRAAELSWLILPVALMLLSSIAALTGMAKLAILTATLGFLVLFVGWLAFSLHYSLILLVSDLCKVLAAGLTGAVGSASNNSPLSVLEQCTNGSDPFQPIKQIAEDGLDYSYGLVCSGFAAACNETYTCYPDGTTEPSAQCPAMQCSPDPSAPCTQSKISQYLLSNVTDFSMGCVDLVTQSVDCSITQGSGQTCLSQHYAPCNITFVPFVQCPTMCRQAQYAALTLEVVDDIALLHTYQNILYDQIFPLLNCSLITNLVSSVEDLTCVQLSDSVFYLSVADCGLACLLTIGLALSILGIKRFNKDNYQLLSEDQFVSELDLSFGKKAGYKTFS